MWEILNANYTRWGVETYPTREAAEKELKQFWRGTSGINLKKFTIREVKDGITDAGLPFA